MSNTRELCGGIHFGEGPRWHEGRLWFSDFYDRAVKTVDPSGNVEVAVQLDGDMPSGLGWLPDGRLLVVSQARRSLLRIEPDGTQAVHADLSALVPFPLNDMVVDGEGRAYVGNPGLDLADLAAGNIHRPLPTTVIVRVDPDGSAVVAADGLVFPNGTVVHDGTLIVAESLARQLHAFTVADDGSLHDGRVWAEVPDVAPDGMCIDADGHVWAANAFGPECVLIAEGGEILERVTTSQPAFACMLGGDDRRTLHVMTAPSFDPRIVAKERNGKVEVVDVAVAGVPYP